MRSFIKALVPPVSAVALLFGVSSAAFAHSDLTYVSWPGPYLKSQMLGYIYPYEQESGQRVDVKYYGGGIDEIRNQVESANVTWDVVDLTQADLLRACKEGLLEELDHSTLPAGADGASYKDDFIDGALHTCGVGSVIWATAYAYDNRAFVDKKPNSIDDFFDVQAFPGRRAIRKDPSVIMEWALLADGVAADKIYETLETSDGLDRAFAQMDKIKPFVVWWENGRDPVRLLNSSEVTMSSIWAATGVEGAKEKSAHFSMGWDGRVIEMDLFGIVKGSRNREASMNFIKYASGTKALAAQSKHLAYGPARKSALALIPEETRKSLPNGPMHDNKVSINSDAKWWAANFAATNERFQAWASRTSQKGASGTTR
jgi:putative spermidine/putrescine transport system substrate-binding protein